MVERTYWLVTCEIVTSGPRSPHCALAPCVATGSASWAVPGVLRNATWTFDFSEKSSEFPLGTLWPTQAPRELGNPTIKTFWSTQKDRFGKARKDTERSCDKTWAILTPRNAHLGRNLIARFLAKSMRNPCFSLESSVVGLRSDCL